MIAPLLAELPSANEVLSCPTFWALLTGTIGLWLLLLTSTPGQGRPQQADTQRHYGERVAYEAHAHYAVRAHILSGQCCDNTAQ